MKKVNNVTNWKDVRGIAKHLGVSKETIYRLLAKRKIPVHRVGKLWKFDPDEVDSAVKRGRLRETLK